MASRNEAKVKLTAETQQFTSQIKEANSALSALRAGMQLNEAQFRNTGNSADYLKQKQSLLKQELEQNRAKQEALTAKLNAAKAAYGENSTQANRLQTQLSKAKTEEQNLETQLTETNNAIEDQAKAEQQAATPLEQLNTKIAEQKSKLAELQTEYANAALSQGKDSEAAQQLKAQIDTLNTELEQNEQQLREVTSATDEAGNAAQSASSGGWTVAKGILADLASNALHTVIDKLKEAAREVVNLGMEFTASLSNVQALSGATSSEMAQLEATAKDLGRNTIFSASQVSDAFGYMALAGWDTQDMLNGVDGVLNLAAASQMDLAQASDIVTDYLTAFGLSASDSGKFVDQMAFAMANSNTNTEQLGEAYKNVAATATSMGFSVEDTTAALMTMANAGVKGGEAGTGLSTIMTRLATNTKGCADKLHEHGVEVYDAQGNMNTLSSILNGCAQIWGDLTQEEQANLAKTIAGTSQYSKFQTVMTGLSEQALENGQSFNDYTEALENCDGAASQMAATMQDNLQGDMTALGSAAEGLGIQLFSLFDDSLRGAAQLATDALNSITDAITPAESTLSNFISEIQSSNDAVASSIDTVNGSISGITATASELDYYAGILVDLNSKTELTEFEQYELKTAVEALSGSIPEIGAAYDSVNGTLSLTNDEILKLIDTSKRAAIQNALIKAQADIYDALAQAMLNEAKAGSAVEKAQQNLNQVMEEGEVYIATNGQVIGKNRDAYIQYTDELNTAKNAQAEAQGQIDELNGQLGELGDTYQYLANENGWNESMEEFVTGAQDATEAADGLQEGVDGFGEEVETEMQTAAQALGMTEEEFEQFRQSVEDSMKGSVDMMNEFNGGTKITAEEVLANLKTQSEGLATWSENMARLAGEAGNGMTQELYNALLEMGPSAANLVQELVNTLDSDTDMFQQICSEWGNAMDLSQNAEALAAAQVGGTAVTEGIVEGLQSGTSQVEGAAQSAADAAAKAADTSGAAKNIASNTKSAMSEASNNITTGMNNIRTQVTTGMTGIGSSFTTGMSTARTQVTTGMSGISTAILSGMTTIRSNVLFGMSAVAQNFGTGMTSARAQVQSGMAGIISAVSSGVGSVNSAASGFNVRGQVLSDMSSALSLVRSYIGSMSSALSVTLRGPNIQVPHFSMSGSFNAQTGAVPTVSVSWYAKGGIFAQPTIFATPFGYKGVGEAGPEAVLPIDTLRGYIEDALDRSTGNIFNINMTVDGAQDPSSFAVEFSREFKQMMRTS